MIFRAQEWAKLCGREDILDGQRNLNNVRICGEHFDSTMFKTPCRKRLVPGAFPTIFRENDAELSGPQAKKIKLRSFMQHAR